MENKKVVVENLTNRRVKINVPDIALRMAWDKKGLKRPIPFEKLEQALYDNGVMYLFQNGILGIDSLEDKIALGLEPEGVKEPVNTIKLDENLKKRLIVTMPIYEFKTMVEKLSDEQMVELAQYAIENEKIDMEKDEIIQERTGINIMTTIRLNRLAKED